MPMIAKWMRKPQGVVAHSGTVYCNAAKLLEVEASFYRIGGNVEGATALALAAKSLRRIGSNAESPDAAFDWPEEVSFRELAATLTEDPHHGT